MTAIEIHTDMRSFEDRLHQDRVHHLVPRGSEFTRCGMHMSECEKVGICGRLDAPGATTHPCETCGRPYCPTCAASYEDDWTAWKRGLWRLTR